MRTRVFPSILLSALVLLIFVSAAGAANCRVTTANDHVDQTCNAADCSLREAILEPSCTTIDFSLDLAGTPIVLTLGELVIGHSVSITGWGADAITISGNNTSRIFYVPPASTLNISGVTLRDGNGMGTLPANGGAIRSLGPVNLNGVYLTGNQAPGQGAAISYEGSANKSIQNSTIAYNASGADPANAAIANGSSSGVVQIFNSSLYGNTGSALFVFGNAALLINSTVAFNGSKAIYANGNGLVLFSNSIVLNLYRSNTFAGIATYGNNIVSTAPGSMGINYMASDQINVDPVLGAPQYNGGHVPIMSLLTGSPAIDTGNNERTSEFFLTTDGRGLTRFVDGDGNGTATVDIGSYEFNAPAAQPVTVSGRVLGGVSGNPVRSQTVAITDMLGNTRTALSSSLGWFVFDNLPAGFVYRVSVKGRRGVQHKTIFADQDISDVDILVPGV